jgi:hypothetical protein
MFLYPVLFLNYPVFDLVVIDPRHYAFGHRKPYSLLKSLFFTYMSPLY